MLLGIKKRGDAIVVAAGDENAQPRIAAHRAAEPRDAVHVGWLVEFAFAGSARRVPEGGATVRDG